MTPLEKEIIAVVAGALTVKEADLTTNTRIEDVVRDSLDVLELLTVLEHRYGARVDPERVTHLTTVGDVARFVEQHRSADRGGASLKNR